MLVEQAAESFLLWRGVKPDTKPVLEAVKSERGGRESESAEPVDSHESRPSLRRYWSFTFT